MFKLKALAYRLAFDHVEGKTPGLRKYAPLIGGAILAAAAFAHVFGQHHLGQTLTEVGGAVGLTQQSPVDGEQLVQLAKTVGEIVVLLGAAWAQAVGIGRKVLAEWRRTHPPVPPPAAS